MSLYQEYKDRATEAIKKGHTPEAVIFALTAEKDRIIHDRRGATAADFRARTSCRTLRLEAFNALEQVIKELQGEEAHA